MPRFDFDHIDPRTNLPRIKQREENIIHTMSQMPHRSCWIKMLQNRVNLNSVGNVRSAVIVWFDIRTKRVCVNRYDKESAVYFREFVLGNGQRPQGWIEIEK